MDTKSFLVFLLVSFSPFFVATSHADDIKRSDFPNGFLFGASTSSYQIEGAFSEDGKGLSNWDVFSHIQGKIVDGQNADVTDDHYHHYQEDVEVMGTLGISAYRLSISWSRILPRGRFGEVNLNGVKFYNKLIDDLLLKGIEPFVTLHHFDLPLELDNRYQSWLSPLIQDDFGYFAEICFKNFGDRVKYWITLNEPNHEVYNAYIIGKFPPGRCSQPFGNCSAGNSQVEPLVVTHNMILSHMKATGIYKNHYQAKQGGYIGMAIKVMFYVPYSDSEADREAVNRAMAFSNAWFLDPVVHGDYPPEMREYLGDHLPKFSKEESNKLKVGMDFIGVNHYVSLYAKDCINSSCDPCSGSAIGGYFYYTGERDGVPIGERTPMPGFFVTPFGMMGALRYLKERYNNKPMIVTENGIAQSNKPLTSESELLNDFKRVEYHKIYLSSVAQAITDGADVRGYFVWSLMDNFEWQLGYTMRFGLHYIN